MQEQIERERLQVAQNQAGLAETALSELVECRRETRNLFLGADRIMRGTELQFYQQSVATAGKAEVTLKKLCAEAAASRDAQRIRYEEAHRRYAVLDKLRERLRREYLVMEGRLEQQRLDEAFTLTNAAKTRQRLLNGQADSAQFCGSADCIFSDDRQASTNT